MRFVSTVALGLVLALGGASFGASAPALAKEATQAPKLNLSKGFMDSARKLSEAANKKDYEAAKAAMPDALAAATSNDDKYFYYSQMLNIGIGTSDAKMQADAVVGMLGTGLVGAAQLGMFNAVAAQNALDAKNYDAAIDYSEKSLAAGYKPEQIYPIEAQAIWGKGGDNKAEIARGLDVFKKGIDAMKAAGQPVPPQWYQVGVQKSAMAELPQLKDWAAMAFDATPTGPNLRTVLRLFQSENTNMTNREDLDVMRLMSVSGGLAVKADYLEYSEMAYKGAFYGEVKAAVEDGRAKGKLTPSDGLESYTIATQRMAADKASLASAAGDAAKSPTGKIAAATADAYLGYADYAKAIPLYEMALQKGGVDVADVTTHLGIAQALGGDTAAAVASFSKVTSGGVRGAIAGYWKLWLTKKPAA